MKKQASKTFYILSSASTETGWRGFDYKKDNPRRSWTRGKAFSPEANRPHQQSPPEPIALQITRDTEMPDFSNSAGFGLNLMSTRLYNALKKEGIDNLQAYKVEMKNGKGQAIDKDKYLAINILGIVSSLEEDIDLSIFRMEGTIFVDEKFKKITEGLDIKTLDFGERAVCRLANRFPGLASNLKPPIDFPVLGYDGEAAKWNSQFTEGHPKGKVVVALSETYDGQWPDFMESPLPLISERFRLLLHKFEKNWMTTKVEFQGVKPPQKYFAFKAPFFTSITSDKVPAVFRSSDGNALYAKKEIELEAMKAGIDGLQFVTSRIFGDQVLDSVSPTVEVPKAEFKKNRPLAKAAKVKLKLDDKAKKEESHKVSHAYFVLSVGNADSGELKKAICNHLSIDRLGSFNVGENEIEGRLPNNITPAKTAKEFAEQLAVICKSVNISKGKISVAFAEFEADDLDFEAPPYDEVVITF